MGVKVSTLVNFKEWSSRPVDGISCSLQKPVCNDYMKGRCDRGDKCKFRHPPEVMGGGPMPPGPGPMSGPHGGPQRFEPYPRHPPGL